MRICYGTPDGRVLLAVASVPIGTPCPAAGDWVELPSPNPEDPSTSIYEVVRTFHRYRTVEEVVPADIRHAAEEDVQVSLLDVVVHVEERG